MEKTRVNTALRLLKGVAAASLATFPGMLLLAAAVVLTPISDKALTVCNQLLKAVCVFLGVWIAVGPGGERGLITGAAVGALYLLAGYGAYCALQGGGAWAMLAGEISFGALLGAAFGALCANLSPRRRNRSARRSSAPRAA